MRKRFKAGRERRERGEREEREEREGSAALSGPALLDIVSTVPTFDC
ncbi:MAG: hypothetical protein ACI83Y_002520 [Candidatus Azotimanducaceae bacterium]